MFCLSSAFFHNAGRIYITESMWIVYNRVWATRSRRLLLGTEMLGGVSSRSCFCSWASEGWVLELGIVSLVTGRWPWAGPA